MAVRPKPDNVSVVGVALDVITLGVNETLPCTYKEEETTGANTLHTRYSV